MIVKCTNNSKVYCSAPVWIRLFAITDLLGIVEAVVWEFLRRICILGVQGSEHCGRCVGKRLSSIGCPGPSPNHVCFRNRPRVPGYGYTGTGVHSLFHGGGYRVPRELDLAGLGRRTKTPCCTGFVAYAKCIILRKCCAESAQRWSSTLFFLLHKQRPAGQLSPRCARTAYSRIVCTRFPATVTNHFCPRFLLGLRCSQLSSGTEALTISRRLLLKSR